MGSDLNPRQQGWLDRLVNLFRSNPPEKVAEEMEKTLDVAPDAQSPEKPDPENGAKPLYKGVSL